MVELAEMALLRVNDMVWFETTDVSESLMVSETLVNCAAWALPIHPGIPMDHVRSVIATAIRSAFIVLASKEKEE